MPPVSEFEFELYRLNLVHEPDGLDIGVSHFKNDEDIIRAIGAASDNDIYEKDPTGTAYYQWRIVEPYILSSDGIDGLGLVACFKLVRETFRKSGSAIDSDGIIKDVDTEMTPPLATAIQVVCFMNRHLAVVEYCSDLMGSNKWKQHLESILAKGASRLLYNSKLLFEAKPRKIEVLEAFESFDKLTKLKVTLRLPNPDLPRYGEELYGRMKAGGVRRYVQEMHNPDGLIRDKGELPYAAIALAEAGYKDGEIELSGEKDGQFSTKKTGGTPDRGRLGLLKSFVRGLKAGASSDDSKKILNAIQREIARLESDY